MSDGISRFIRWSQRLAFNARVMWDLDPHVILLTAKDENVERCLVLGRPMVKHAWKIDQQRIEPFSCYFEAEEALERLQQEHGEDEYQFTYVIKRMSLAWSPAQTQ